MQEKHKVFHYHGSGHLNHHQAISHHRWWIPGECYNQKANEHWEISGEPEVWNLAKSELQQAAGQSLAFLLGVLTENLNRRRVGGQEKNDNMIL